VKILTTPQQPKEPQKIEIQLDADIMTKLKTRADTTNKTPSEIVAELLREQLK